MSGCRKGYHSPARPQTDSSILQLPVEIRTKILRCLMRSLSVVSPPHVDADHRESSLALSFSSHLLRCCQQLYAEGHEVLYGENTLQIVCSRKIDALNGSINLPDDAEKVDSKVDDIMDWAVRARNQALRERIPLIPTQYVRLIPPNETLVNHFINAIPAMSSFEKVEVLVDCHGWHADEQFYLACRALKGLVRQKDVTLSVVERAIPTSNHWHVQPCYTWDIGSCQIWDCKTLNINTNSHGKQETYLRCPEQQKRGHSPIRDTMDTLQKYQNFKSVLRLFCACASPDEYHNEYWSAHQEDTEKCWELTPYMQLRTSIFKYDLQQVVRQSFITLRAFDGTLATWTRLLIRDIHSCHGDENYKEYYEWYISELAELEDHMKTYEARRDLIKQRLRSLAEQLDISVNDVPDSVADSGVPPFGV